MVPPATPARRAAIVGTGLIGSSIGMGLRRGGWRVSGVDRDPARIARALELGALDEDHLDPQAEVTFVATPVGGIVEAAREALATTRGVVTDVGSVKAPVVGGIDDERFVGGHPMAGSEQEGVAGASADLFEGAVWVLTPVDGTAHEAYATVRRVVASLGAEVVALPPHQHDALVALVSHVPHLAAATLMQLADGRAVDHRAVLRLAAGGFRDMTRIAAGSPSIWPDICTENREAIVGVLDQLVEELQAVRAVVAQGDRDALLDRLEAAREARRNLPLETPQPEDLAVLRVPVPDRPGSLAEVTTLATELGINIVDLEIAHSSEGGRGVLILTVEAAAADRLRGVLRERGLRASQRSLG